MQRNQPYVTPTGDQDWTLSRSSTIASWTPEAKLRRIKRRLIHRAALLGYKLCWEEETDSAVLLEWDGGKDKWAIGPEIKGIPAVRSFLGLLEGRGV